MPRGARKPPCNLPPLACGCAPRALLVALLLASLPVAAAPSPSTRLPEPLLPGALEQPGVARAGALTVLAPPLEVVEEEQELRLTVEVLGGRGPVRVRAEGLPPGARWEEYTRTLTFRPDFIQGGWQGELLFTATDGVTTAQARTALVVLDTVQPPEPRVTRVELLPGCLRLTLEQPTDAWLDSPGHAGRTFQAVVTVPLGASARAPLPVAVRLHGVGSWPPQVVVSTDRFLIEPSDPLLTYWWGHAESVPGAEPQGAVVPYTARRVLALLEWVLRTRPGADPERVFIEGSSMGGAGALALGLLHARHFAGVHAAQAQPVPRAHRRWRLEQLSTLWGAPELDLPGPEGLGTWRRLDLTRALRDEPEARSQHVWLEHGKDDKVIHFGAVVRRSALTGLSFYEALQGERVGHVAVWDEGGHFEADPWLGERWWEQGREVSTHVRSLLRRDTAFAAFSGSSWDGNPGRGQGNGRQRWYEEGGYAGQPEVPGDTGWDGEDAGMLNRGLRWDGRRVVDTWERLVLPLRAVRGPGVGSLPVVDVTPRRVQRFHCLPGEPIRWRFGRAQGQVQASSDGSVTVPGLRLRDTWTDLVLERVGQGP